MSLLRSALERSINNYINNLRECLTPLYVDCKDIGKSNVLEMLKEEMELNYSHLRSMCLAIEVIPKALNDDYTIFQNIDILIIEDIDLMVLDVKAQKQVVEIIDHFMDSNKLVICISDGEINSLRDLSDSIVNRLKLGLYIRPLVSDIL